MTSKPVFMSAPRPASRLTPEEARRLVEASADLGFARTGAQSVDVPAQAVPELTISEPLPPEPAVVTPPAPARIRKAVTSRVPVTRAALPDQQTLRVDVPADLWTALKLESVHRRVTVRYLLLEALSKAGYAVDLENVPEDGRRLR